MLKVIGASWEQTRLTLLFLGIVTVLAIIAIVFYEVPLVKNDGYYSATAYWTESYNNFRVVYLGQNNNAEDISRGVARAYYREDSTNSGWATLEIQTTESYPDRVQAYAAGLLEGSLCWRMIYWHWQNTIANTCKDREEYCIEMRTRIRRNAEKMKDWAVEYDSTDAFWHQVNMFYTQLEGLEEGWKSGVDRSRKKKYISISHVDFLWMNSISDLRDLEFKYNVTKSYDPLSPANSIALLKYLPHSTPNFLLAHRSAGYYSDMLRVQKKYSFNFHYTASNSSLVPGNTTIFTSYPGSLYSQDDFYQIFGESKLTIAGSIVKNYNDLLWKKVDFDQALMGPRVMAANRLAKNGTDWVKLMSRRHSGTGNKQWLVLKSNHGTPELLVLEQMPNSTVAKNMTQFWHNTTYWMSYGVPYFEEVRQMSGYGEGESGAHLVQRMKRVVEVLNYGQKKVNSEESMLKLMRHPAIAAVGRSDITVPYSEVHHIVRDDGFSVHFGKHNKPHSTANLITDDVKSIKRFHLFQGVEDRNEKDIYSSVTEDNYQIDFATSDLKFREYDGLIDLKIALGLDSFKAAAGPPFTDASDSVRVKPFQWSKSRNRHIPHYGQRDKWEFKPTSVTWVW